MPPRPAPLTFTFECGATDGAAAECAPLARRPRPAAPSRLTPRPNPPPHPHPHPHTPPRPGLQCTTVHHAGFSFSDNRGESRNRVADKRCATRCARNSRAASHSPAGSVSQAGKWRKRREAACAHTPWSASQILRPSRLPEPLGEHRLVKAGERRRMKGRYDIFSGGMWIAVKGSECC